ncbi:MAG: hypothetical protein LBD06_04430 [Candidatus Accumulibacter sp.]|nr:hypothetical protein [Accumulibacter sp.]
MTEKPTVFDPDEYLKSDPATAGFMTAAFDASDPAHVAHAEGNPMIGWNRGGSAIDFIRE